MESEPRQSDLLHVSEYLKPLMRRLLAPIELNLGQLAFDGLESDADPAKVIYRRPARPSLPPIIDGQDTLF